MNAHEPLSPVVRHLRSRREALGLSRDDASRLSGISSYVISRIETKPRSLNACDLIRLGRALWPLAFDDLWSKLPVGGDVMDAVVSHVIGLPVVKPEDRLAGGLARLLRVVTRDAEIDLGSRAFFVAVKLLGCLTLREALIINWWFNPFGAFARPLTYREIGARFDVTRERIRQIEAKALRKMRSTYGRLQVTLVS